MVRCESGAERNILPALLQPGTVLPFNLSHPHLALVILAPSSQRAFISERVDLGLSPAMVASQRARGAAGDTQGKAPGSDSRSRRVPAKSGPVMDA